MNAEQNQLIAQVLEEVLRTTSMSVPGFRENLHARIKELRASAAEAGKGETVHIDGRDHASALDAALHLLWLLQRLSYYEPEREGQPCDGFRFRDGIKEARKLLALLRYEDRLEHPAQPAADRSQDARDEEALKAALHGWYRGTYKAPASDFSDGFRAALRHARSAAPVQEENAVSLQEALARIRKWQEWADYACKRFTEETGKDLQAAAGS